MSTEAVASLDDARLDDYRNLTDAELLHTRGVFAAEGRLVVRRLLTESPLATRSVMLTETARGSMAEALSLRPEIPVYVVPQHVMDGVAGFNVHRGCLAIGEYPRPRAWIDVIAGTRTVVVLERVANPDNVGGIFRCAAAFGADAVLLDPSTTDPLYRKAIRTSMGAALVVPFARLNGWPSALNTLREQGFALVALTPRHTASLVATMDETSGRRVALVLGNEGEGLTEGAMDACEFQARIPTTSRVDSLNVVSAAAIALYERNARPRLG
ncbi:MAG: RNA methyltransferase [Acidobacteria bacterium]|nr:RNA methyltransferase [Acidobacteriota bacterium]